MVTIWPGRLSFSPKADRDLLMPELLTSFFSSPPPPLPPNLPGSFLPRCPLPSERQARLEAVREVFLAAYSSTVGLQSSAPSPSGAISGLLEQFARGVGLRATSTIV